MILPRSKLFLLVGPSGTGKTTILDALIKRSVLVRAISHSTRPMRPGESYGNPYYFTTLESFKQLERDGAFIEQVIYNGNHYGFTHSEIIEALKEGNVGLIVEGHGAEQIMALFPSRTHVIFLMPPSAEELARRMRERGNTEAEVAERLALVESEMAYLHLANSHILTNQPLTDVINAVQQVIESER